MVKKVKLPNDDKIYYTIAYSSVILLTFLVVLPLINIFASSFSSPAAVNAGKVVLWPVDWSIAGYIRIFSNQRVWIGYRNTILYTVAGTLINVSITLFCAYALARKGLPHKGFFSFLFVFTMLFSGGLIPTYMLVRDLRMLNTIWAMMLPGAMGVYQMIVTRTFIQSNIPAELLEMAKIDGCNDFNFFVRFVLPLSKPVIAVISMQYAVGHWNAYFDAFIYLTNRDLFPLQSYLREILIMNQMLAIDYVDPETAVAMQGLADLLKYSLIVVATVPILCVYPFIQKYFVHGIMIGSLKG